MLFGKKKKDLEYEKWKADYDKKVSELKSFRDVGDSFTYLGVEFCVYRHFSISTIDVSPALVCDFRSGDSIKRDIFSYAESKAIMKYVKAHDGGFTRKGL